MTQVDLLCDLQYGSTGKGLFAGYLGYTREYTAAVSSNMPNAGHTFVDGKDKFIFKALPIAAISPKVSEVFIGPGAVFDPDQILEEWNGIPNKGGKRLFIHECAMALQPGHVIREQDSLNHIASTMQGSMAAMTDKMKRNPDLDCRIKTLNWVGRGIHIVNQRDYHNALKQHDNILVEGSQGYSLGINAGFWPYCTSRDCTPARTLADCGVPVQWLRHVYGTLRTFPIRVGNTEGGNSGPVYVDQEELTWEEIGQDPEMTTVTGRVRRVFSFSWLQYKEAWVECRPDYIFLNFINYMDRPDPFMKGVRNLHIRWGGDDPMYYGVGPDLNDVRVYEAV